VDILRELVEVPCADARVLDPRGGLEAMKAHVDALVAAPSHEHRGGREVAVQNARAVAVRNRLDDLLEEAEALVEGEVRLLTNEGVERERVFEGLEEHRRAEWRVVDEGAVREDSRVLADLRERLRLALGSTMELRASFGRGRSGHEVAAHARL